MIKYCTYVCLFHRVIMTFINFILFNNKFLQGFSFNFI